MKKTTLGLLGFGAVMLACFFVFKNPEGSSQSSPKFTKSSARAVSIPHDTPLHSRNAHEISPSSESVKSRESSIHPFREARTPLVYFLKQEDLQAALPNLDSQILENIIQTFEGEFDPVISEPSSPEYRALWAKAETSANARLRTLLGWKMYQLAMLRQAQDQARRE